MNLGANSFFSFPHRVGTLAGPAQRHSLGSLAMNDMPLAPEKSVGL